MDQPHGLVTPHSNFPHPSYLIETDDLSICFLDLPQFHQKVPEPRLRDDRVWGKDSHAVELWGWVGL